MECIFYWYWLTVLIIVAADFGLLGKMPSIEELQNPTASLSARYMQMMAP